MAVFEVFRQERDGDAMVHAGSVEAPDRELALDYAREFYSRRQESVRLWVVDRSQVVQLDDPDLLKPPLERDFKKPEGYVITEKLRRVRERARQAQAETGGGAP